MNDVENFLVQSGAVGLSTLSVKMEHELNIYLRLLVLLYADDTILMAESATELQKQLNIFHNYCTKWKLRVNVDKTKIMIFGKGR